MSVSGVEPLKRSVESWLVELAGKTRRIFPRKCYACGEKMTLQHEGWPIIECKACEVWENGTLNYKLRTVLPDEYEWGGELISFIDHSKVYVPSP